MRQIEVPMEFSLEELRERSGISESFHADPPVHSPTTGMSAREWAAYWKVSYRAALQSIRELMQCGTMQFVREGHLDLIGRHYDVVIYRVVVAEEANG